MGLTSAQEAMAIACELEHKGVLSREALNELGDFSSVAALPALSIVLDAINALETYMSLVSDLRERIAELAG
jgi:hypothetical protein